MGLLSAVTSDLAPLDAIALELVAGQLRAANPQTDWVIAGHDRALELAGLFVNYHGIHDLTKLSLERMDPKQALEYAFGYDYQGFKPTRPKTIETPMGRAEINERISWDEYIKDQGHIPFRLNYEGRNFGYLGDINRDGSYSNTYKILMWNPVWQVPMIAWSSYGDGNVSYCFLIKSDGFAIIPFWQSSSAGDKAAIQEGLIVGFTFASFAFSFGMGGSIAKEIGSQIVGSAFAATNPAMTIVIGNTAIGTVLNGGDFETAAKRAVINNEANAAGSYVGSVLGGLTDSQLTGNLAAAAVGSYIKGGDPALAVSQVLIQAGASKVESLVETQKEPTMEISVADWSGIDSYSPFGDVSFGSMPDTADWSFDQSPLIAPSVNDTFGIPSFTSFIPDFGSPVGNPFESILGNTLPPAAAPLPAVIPGASGKSGWDYAKEALKYVPGIVQALKDPKPAGSGVVAADGSVNTRALSPNQPVVLPDGRIIVRGTDGNITMVDQKGNVIGANTKGGVFGLSPLAIGGIAAGALAIFFLARRR